MVQGVEKLEMLICLPPTPTRHRPSDTHAPGGSHKFWPTVGPPFFHAWDAIGCLFLCSSAIMQEPPKAPRREHHEEHQVKALEKHQELQEHPVPPVSQLARSQNAQGPHDTVERRHPLTAKETTTDKIMPVRRSIPPAIRNFWFARQRFRKSRDPTEEEIKYMEDLRLQDLQFFQKEIAYSPAYYDDTYEYRHVILPKEISRWLPSMDCLEESEWRELGVTKMTGWEHYMVHAPEPHILLFRRARQRREKPPPKEANENVAPPTEANEATNTTSS